MDTLIRQVPPAPLGNQPQRPEDTAFLQAMRSSNMVSALGYVFTGMHIVDLTANRFTIISDIPNIRGMLVDDQRIYDRDFSRFCNLLIHKDHQEAFLKTFCNLDTCREYYRTGQTVSLDIRRMSVSIQGVTSPEQWLRVHFIPLAAEVAGDMKAIIVFANITTEIQRRQDLEASLKHAEEVERKLYREAAFLRASNDGKSADFMVNLTNDQIVDGSTPFLKIVQARGGTFSGWIRHNFEVGIVHPEDVERWKSMADLDFYRKKFPATPYFTHRIRISPRVAAETAGYPLEKSPFDTSREWAWIEFQFTIIEDLDHQLYMFVKEVDVSAQVDEQLKQKRDSQFDPLTGCLTRSALENSIQQYISQEGAQGAFLLADMDYFRKLNEAKGHSFGDGQLVEIAELLRSMFRSSDLLARIGGDSFAVFLPGPQDRTLLMEKALLLESRARRTFVGEFGNSVELSLSIGISLLPDHGCSYDALFSKADLALYQSKRKSGSRVTIYDEIETAALSQEARDEGIIVDADYRRIIESLVTIGIYVVSAAEHRILFFNRIVKEVIPNIRLGDVCHEVWGGHCENCPINMLGDHACTQIISRNDPFGKEVETTATKLLWKGNIPAYLIRVYPRIVPEAAERGPVISQKPVQLLVDHSGGSYEIDENYQVVRFDQAAKACYPQLEVGMPCYQCLMDREAPCPNCPVKNDTASNSLVSCQKLQQGEETRYRLVFHSVIRQNPTNLFDTQPPASEATLGSYELPAYYLGSQADVPPNHTRILTELLRNNRAGALASGYYDEEYSIQFISQLGLEMLNFPSFDAFSQQTGLKFKSLLLEGSLEPTTAPTQGGRNSTIIGYGGTHLPASLRCTCVQSKSGRKMWYVSFRMVSDNYIDTVTGAYTRSGFIDQMEELRSSGEDLTKYIILYLDIDDFKAINELYSVKGGDNLLRITHMMVVSSQLHPRLTGRMEGDHFIALFQADALNQMDFGTLHAFIWNYRGKRVNVHARCSLYRIENSRMSISGMLDRAKLARQYVTDEHAGPYAMYDNSMRADYMVRAEVLADYKDAIANREFKVFYQPVVSAKTGRVVSAEALIRWQHPVKGMISPGLFMPALEEHGSISRVDAYVNQEVYRFLKKRFDSGQFLVPVSVNLSWKDFQEMHLMKSVMQNATDGSLPQGTMRYEITETSYAALEGNTELLQRLHEEGVKVLLDDFGSGVSSFGMIQNYDFDIVKLDMSFVRQLEEKPKVRSIVRAIITMCHELGISVIAEGVETYEQLSILRCFDCDYIQGYYFSKPLDEAHFTAYLEAQSTLPEKAPAER